MPEIKFLDSTDVTGDATRGAICAAVEDDRTLFTVVVRLSRTLSTLLGLDGHEVDLLLPGRAPTLVELRLDEDPAWRTEGEQGEVTWTLTSADVEWWTRAAGAALVQAVEHDDPDPAGRPVRQDIRVHAYDIDLGRAPHPPAGSYLIREDRAWRDGTGGIDRCAQCERLLGSVT